MRISLAQVTSGTEPADNLKIIESYTRAAYAAGSSLVVFPEAMMRSFSGPIRGIAEPLDGPWADAVREIAQRIGITVVAGMFTPADSGRVGNTLLITGPTTEAHYDKIHLFDAFGFAESDTVAPGSDPLVLTIDDVTVGFATCYDLRFPALFQRLGDLGAELIVVPASWGSGPGKVEQWSLLARARALDSTAFVAACDQAEPDNTGGTAPLGVGHSVVSSPTGEILGELDATPGLLTVDIDAALVAPIRAKLPVLANRRQF
ncbi:MULTISPECIES: carbon-nitrogen hydrolase family protein [unclassified Rhodococcus (in: high G+C Gram-positive bacteria)]|uniref:carbon-nitrogen hydrolase family protein n=1 Tax=unclassified Rhodococcus (in: high G+C Gram-positive bacteria) TaxID=192944 RepID=UPI001B34E7B3|nr:MULTISPECIES: carbon-nitrogen hydrolase family protein [unclassified Rhodococcus (in: high G+C Gram-positive bacteria)]